VAGSCENGDEPLGFGATELDSYLVTESFLPSLKPLKKVQ
jgi:hypothetical protein